MRYKTITPSLFIKNRKKLNKKIQPHSLVIVNANDEMPRTGDQFFPFRQNSDIFYLSGLDQEKCILAICPDHPNKKYREIIFTVKADQTMTTWLGHKYNKEEVKEISGVQTVMWLDDFEITLRELMFHVDRVYLNQNEYVKFSPDVPSRDTRFSHEIRDKFPVHTYHRLAPLFIGLRLIKEPEEIALLQKACDLTNDAFHRVLKFIRPGVMEYEVEAEMTHEFIRKGASGHAYLPIIGSGNNALVLHYTENNNICKEGDLVLMDFGAEYANYVADCTRTIPVNGKFTPRQRECYEAVLRVQKTATAFFVPGNTIDQINKKVNKLMEKEMIGLGLFSEEDVKKQNPEKPLYFNYLMHGVSHPIGLDVHDVGSKYIPFEKGMVFTLEPAIYIEKEGIGIRIENDIMVDDTPVDLMKEIPREVGEIEALMGRGLKK
ncbi:MAG: aminopeptidase P N-terminal domain-containing protein [Bacteroidales bacterium]|nr:aminopeptidase P N-terminal domain-containing protein [Bacteroidales bacterium]